MASVTQTSQHSDSHVELPAALMNVLERFNESSSKLEARYASLVQEVEHLREQLRMKDEEVKRAERLAMLGETAAGLAHEIRNPLGAISLFVSMLREEVREQPTSLDLVDQIQRGIRSLDGVVSNVLHFAKNNRFQMAPMNIQSVVQELQQHFVSLYSPQCSFEVSLSGNPFIRADAQAVRQALYNIIINSLQAVSFAGSIGISVADCPDRDGVRVVLSDDGPGIPEELQSRLFQPFTSGRRDGTGLGLSIVRRIVEAHGGAVSARNTPHAEFTIVLPRVGCDAAQGA